MQRKFRHSGLPELLQISDSSSLIFILYVPTSRTLSRRRGFTLVTWPRSVPVEKCYRPPTELKRLPTLKPRWIARHARVPMPIHWRQAPDVALCFSDDPSFDTASTEENNVALISAWDVLLNDECQACSGEGTPAAEDEAYITTWESSCRTPLRGKWRRHGARS